MAVYTDVTDEDLDAFLSAYAIGEPIGFKGIAEGVSNSNFLLNTTADRFILTIYEARTEEAALPYFVGLMDHLAAHGVACPAPIRRKDGAIIGRLGGKPAAIVSYLDGLSVRRPSVAHCREAGAAMARLHLAGRDFAGFRANALDVAGWSALLEKALPRAHLFNAKMVEPLHAELQHIRTQWPDDLPKGVIHADLFPDNVFFTGGAVSGIIDFYFACNDAFAYDLAIGLNAWCFEPDFSYNVTKGRAMVAGYQSIRRLERTEIAALPVLARSSAMRFLSTRLYDWLAALDLPAGTLVRPHDPRPYWERIKFHQKALSAADYGVETA
jgi:homoserine kinase type II